MFKSLLFILHSATFFVHQTIVILNLSCQNTNATNSWHLEFIARNFLLSTIFSHKCFKRVSQRRSHFTTCIYTLQFSSLFTQGRLHELNVYNWQLKNVQSPKQISYSMKPACITCLTYWNLSCYLYRQSYIVLYQTIKRIHPQSIWRSHCLQETLQRQIEV